jgi:hypothetical protein
MGSVLLLLNACDPVYRYNRLVNNYPYLVNRQVFDTIHIRDGKVVDTTFIWSQGRDTTIYIGNARIERFRDTLRFYYREQNCTTHVAKTEIHPSRETTILKEGKRLSLLEKVALGLIVALIIVGAWRR